MGDEDDIYFGVSLPISDCKTGGSGNMGDELSILSILLVLVERIGVFNFFGDIDTR